jgi:hypothetical protein
MQRAPASIPDAYFITIERIATLPKKPDLETTSTNGHKYAGKESQPQRARFVVRQAITMMGVQLPGFR